MCVCIIIPPSFSPSLSSRDMMMEFAVFPQNSRFVRQVKKVRDGKWIIKLCQQLFMDEDIKGDRANFFFVKNVFS